MIDKDEVLRCAKMYHECILSNNDVVASSLKYTFGKEICLAALELLKDKKIYHEKIFK